MKSMGNQLLKAGCAVSALVTSVIWVAFFVQLFKSSKELDIVDYFIQNPNIATYPLFCIFSIVILVKANSNKGVLWFSLFLSLISQNIGLMNFFNLDHTYDIFIIPTISFILTSIAYLKSVQNFPQQITEEDLNREFSKNKVVRSYLSACLKKQMWIVLTLIITVLALLFPRNLTMQAIVLSIVLFTAIPFLYVNFKISSPSSRNKISWLFWGILTYTFLSILNSVFVYSGSEVHENIASLFNLLRALSLFVSVTMCLFFFDTFNTGVLIRRTIVDGIIFIVIILLYNTIEHYILHWLTHKMHISNTIISSVLSGFFVLIFSPVHHKFMHFLDLKFKRTEPNHRDTENKEQE